jgi:DNA-binding MarR family transcriptional regulator
LFLAYNLTPEPISADLFQLRNPYANPGSVQEILEDAAAADYLEKAGEGEFRPTQKGSSAIETVHKAFYSHVNQVNQFPAEQLKELCSLMAKLVDSISQTDLGGRKICFDASYGGHIQADHGTLARVDQHLDDLNAFRDDAHIAAWKSAEVDGHTWEVLTFIWNSDATTAEKLAERLPYRQYTTDNYQTTLEDLVKRGWIEIGNDGHVVTAKGKKIRDDAEDGTNKNYFGAWKVLSDDELEKLGELLTALKKTNLKLMPEDDAE